MLFFFWFISSLYISNEKFVWEQILTDKYDDMKAYVGTNSNYLDKFADDLQNNIVCFSMLISRYSNKII